MADRAREKRAAAAAADEAAGDKCAKTGLFKWKPDHEGAAAAFQRAAPAFRAAKDFRAAARCHAKAAAALAACGIPHAAGKELAAAADATVDAQKTLGFHTDCTAGAAAPLGGPAGGGAAAAQQQELKKGSPEWAQAAVEAGAAAAALHECASMQYAEAGNPDAAAAVAHVRAAVETFQEEGREAFSNTAYRFALALTVKSAAFEDAVGLLQTQARSFETLKQFHEMHKALLAVIVLQLKLDDYVAASEAFSAAVQESEGFGPSAESRAGAALLDAFEKRDADLLHAALDMQCFTFLDNQVARVAQSLRPTFGTPEGKSKADLAAAGGGSSSSAAGRAFGGGGGAVGDASGGVVGASDSSAVGKSEIDDDDVDAGHDDDNDEEESLA